MTDKDKKSKKHEQMKQYEVSNEGNLTTDEGVKIAEDDFSLKAGLRGPTLMQDFHFQEKMMHFDRERIPERVVHARGTGAYGTFTLTNDMSKYTAADFLCGEKGKQTDLFLRFSTVGGFRGSADTVRDPRGFAVKFYTEEGNFDLPGLSLPVFFIQDGMKFPDFIHSVKPEPKTETPQAQSAHDNFWDFVSTNHETANALFWHMSDRDIPRSYRMVEGFGIHTYKFVNNDGEVFFVKFHFKPELGVHSFVWDEAQTIAGKDPDYHRKDLQEAIDKGDYPRWKFGVQIIAQKDEFMFDFDILDPTKFWPEELVPVTEMGVMELNRNPENFFAETEQAAFHPGNMVRGIEPSNDPLLQGRLFSYSDTQIYRLGGPNFKHIPVNRPINETYNNQRDGFMQTKIHTAETNYSKNRIEEDKPLRCPFHEGGYMEEAEKMQGFALRGRPEKFMDFYTQPKLFLNSLEEVEKQHIADAFKFELSKVSREEVRQNSVNFVAKVDKDMAKEIADYLGLEVKEETEEMQTQGNADRQEDFEYEGKKVEKSPAVSMENTAKKPNTMKLGVLLTDDYDKDEVDKVLDEAEKAGIYVNVVADHMGKIGDRMVAESFTSADAVNFDAIYVASVDSCMDEIGDEIEDFISDTYKHFKPIMVSSKEEDKVSKAMYEQDGVEMIADDYDKLIEMVTQMRFWNRKKRVK
ncbi:MAG: catalase [Tissierellia bacterium]|nr:catalase [Tissierellia bacterium]